jgi:hypothetical protein
VVQVGSLVFRVGPNIIVLFLVDPKILVVFFAGQLNIWWVFLLLALLLQGRSEFGDGRLVSAMTLRDQRRLGRDFGMFDLKPLSCLVVGNPLI